jgi:hypothetical protein
VALKKANGGMTAAIDLPQGTETRVLFPVATAASQVLVNDRPRDGQAAEEGKRKEIQLGPRSLRLARAIRRAGSLQDLRGNKSRFSRPARLWKLT